MNEKQEKKRRYNLRLEYIARFNKWLDSCFGWVDLMTDYPLPECSACPDFVDKAQDDLEAFYWRKERT